MYSGWYELKQPLQKTYKETHARRKIVPRLISSQDGRSI